MIIHWRKQQRQDKTEQIRETREHNAGEIENMRNTKGNTEKQNNHKTRN